MKIFATLLIFCVILQTGCQTIPEPCLSSKHIFDFAAKEIKEQAISSSPRQPHVFDLEAIKARIARNKAAELDKDRYLANLESSVQNSIANEPNSTKSFVFDFNRLTQDQQLALQKVRAAGARIKQRQKEDQVKKHLRQLRPQLLEITKLFLETYPDCNKLTLEITHTDGNDYTFVYYKPDDKPAPPSSISSFPSLEQWNAYCPNQQEEQTRLLRQINQQLANQHKPPKFDYEKWQQQQQDQLDKWHIENQLFQIQSQLQEQIDEQNLQKFYQKMGWNDPRY